MCKSKIVGQKIRRLFNCLLALLIVRTVHQKIENSFFVEKKYAQGQIIRMQMKIPQQKEQLSFKWFIQKMSKNYQTYYEELYRRIIYLKNVQKIRQHNSNSSRSYQMGINHFADMSQQQFLAVYASLQHFESPKTIFHTTKTVQQRKQPSQDGKAVIYHNTINIWNNIEIHINFFQRNCQQTQKPKINQPVVIDQPVEIKNIDWSNVSGPVNDQGACGACYVFSVVDHISSLHMISKKTQQFTGLSSQQILDCGYSQISQGCLGGFLQGSLAYVQTNGVTTSKRYPYRSGKTGKQLICASRQGQFKIAYFQSIEVGNCYQLKKTLQKKTIPVGIAGYRLQFYQSGTFTDCNDHIDHAVLLVGYNDQKGWKIKNSWGDWGEKGYAWIENGNKCGICNMAVVATVQNQGQLF